MKCTYGWLCTTTLQAQTDLQPTGLRKKRNIMVSIIYKKCFMEQALLQDTVVACFVGVSQ